MLVVMGLVILLAAVIFGVAGVLQNTGSAHASGGFSVLGIDVTGSTGTLFLIGVVVGLVAALGLALLLTGARRAARRGNTARRELKQSRRETAAVSEQRDALMEQRDADRHPPPGAS